MRLNALCTALLLWQILLACAIATESIRLLLESPWQQNIQRIEHSLKQQLSPLAEKDYVKEVRVLGAIGVVEMKSAGNMKTLVPRFCGTRCLDSTFRKIGLCYATICD